MISATVKAVRELAKKTGTQPPLILAVTVLTSMTGADLAEIGIREPVEQVVVGLARLAQLLEERIEDEAAASAVAARNIWHMCRQLNDGHCTSLLCHQSEFIGHLDQANGSRSCVGCESQRCAVSEQAHSICLKGTHRVNI